jgi:hypothetical protein
MPMMGPKLSSRISSMLWFTLENTVGWYQLPGPGPRAPPASRCALGFGVGHLRVQHVQLRRAGDRANVGVVAIGSPVLKF